MRRAAVTVLVGVAAALAGCGTSGDAKKHPAEDPFVAVGKRHARPEPPHAAPRWQRVSSFAGSGSAVRRFEIRDDALQWRAVFSCERGALELSAEQRDARAERLVAARCPRSGRSLSLKHGRLALAVRATGAWRVRIEQQIDTPISERPLAAMSAAGSRVVGRGRFYGVERKGQGTVALYRLASGRLALRLDHFATTTNTDLVVWLSAARRPQTSRQAFGAPYTQVAALKATIGAQNYLVPRDVTERDLRSVVIWCVPARIAYTAARLSRP